MDHCDKFSSKRSSACTTIICISLHSLTFYYMFQPILFIIMYQLLQKRLTCAVIILTEKTIWTKAFRMINLAIKTHDNSPQECSFDAFVSVHSSIVSGKLFLPCDCLSYTVHRDYQKHLFFIRYVAISLLSSQYAPVNLPTTATYSSINRPGLLQQANSSAAQRARSHPVPIIKTENC